MGAVISKAANGIGGALGNVFTAPFKRIINDSCVDVCQGPWDIICFIEHLCVTDLMKLLMILGLCYIILLFCYLWYKVGICQCIVRSLCKMCWAACKTYWYALEYITCFLWHKLMNTKRRNRRRRYRDAELGYSSSNDIDFSDYHHHLSSSGNRDRRHRDAEFGYSSSIDSDISDYHRHLSSSRKRHRERNNWYGNGSHHRHHLKIKRRKVSFLVRGGSRRLRKSRRLKLVKVRIPRTISKRRRLR